MGLDLAQRSGAAAALLALASRAVSEPLVLARGGPRWGRTEVMQPLLVAVALATAERLFRAGVRPLVVLGHSLGELSAWAAAGAISAEAAVALAAERGRLMAREAARAPGGMVSVTGVSEAEVARALAARAGMLVLAGRNAPEAFVLSGDEAALAALELPHRRLPADGAWHSPAMRGATAELAAAVATVPRMAPHAIYVGAASAMDPDAIPRHLVDQLVFPFRLDLALAALVALGVDTFVTIGPAKPLRALVSLNLCALDRAALDRAALDRAALDRAALDRGGRVRVIATDDARALDGAIAELAG